MFTDSSNTMAAASIKKKARKTSQPTLSNKSKASDAKVKDYKDYEDTSMTLKEASISIKEN